jgi:gliding motility-associated-like protein
MLTIFFILFFGQGLRGSTLPIGWAFLQSPWILYNAATPVTHNCKECFQLTEEVTGQKGCIWHPDPVDFSGPIDIEATMYFGTLDGNGADGICLVFAPSPGCGESGFGIGAHGIPNAVIVEFDTWNNGPAGGDIPNDHVAVNINGDVTNPVLGPSDLGNIEDGQDHTIRFFWDGAGGIEIYFDGALVLSGSYDLAGAMGSNQVFMGYTASTGGAVNTHIVCPDNIPTPAPEPPVFTQFDLEVCEGDQGVVYAVVPVPDVTYSWTIPPGASLNGNGAGISIGWGAQGGEVCVKVDNGCHESDTVCVTVEVTLLPDVQADAPGALCLEEFDLSDLVLLNLDPGHQVSYHPSQAAALAGVPDLGTPPVVQFSGTYWLRIEAGDGCVQTLPVDLILEYPEILVEQPDPVCAPGSVELSLVNIIESKGLPMVFQSFHLSFGDAFNNLNPLDNSNITISGTYWVRSETANGCFDVAAIEVLILPPPELSVIDPPAQCAAGSFDLSTIDFQELSGLGPGEYNLSFHLTFGDAQNGTPALDPPVVTQVGIYWVRITNLAGCFDLAPVEVVFLPTPVVRMSAPDRICAGETAALHFLFEGTASFEVWYSNGVDTFNFSTAQTSHTELIGLQGGSTIQILSFTDNAPPGCPALIDGPLFIAVNALPQISTPLVICDNNQYIVTFQLLGGDSLSWQVAGTPGQQNGSFFQSAPQASGQGYQFTIWDANGCDTLTVSAIPDCSCETNAGTFVENAAQACIGDTLFLTFSEDGFLDSNDLRQYVLHTGGPFNLGQVLQWRNAPFFTFDPALMTPGQTYYAAPVAGNALAGQVDTGEVCFSLVRGIPVTFHEPPSLILPPDDTVCVSQVYGLPLLLEGVAPFNLTYQVGVLSPVSQPINGSTFLLNLPTAQSIPVAFSLLSDAHCSRVLTDTFFLYVNTGPTAANFQFDCNGTNTEFTISFTIMGGDPASYTVTGGPGTLTGNVFKSDPLPVGQPYSFLIDDAYHCKPYSVSGTYACLCITEAGAISGGPFNLCPGDTLDFTNPGLLLDQNDTIVWWLVTDQTHPLGTRIHQWQGRRIYYPGLPVTFGTTYFLVGLAGNQGPIGGIDTLDACLDLTALVPVRFVLPPVLAGVTASPDGIFSCQDTLITLMAQASAPGNLSYQWSTQGGLISGPSSGNPIQAAGPGWYSVTVTESQAGCRDTMGILLTQSADLPVVQIVPPGRLDCRNDQISLDAGGSSSGAGFILTWTTTDGLIVSGGSSLQPIVGALGTYVLTIQNTLNNCSAQGSVTVLRDTLEPLARAGADVTVACGQSMPILNGSASSGQGTLTFRWSTLGGGLPAQVDQASVQVLSPGVYILEVTDPVNGCTATDTVRVTLAGGLNGLSLQAVDPACAGEASGTVEILAVTGGVAPYRARLAGREITIPGVIGGLAAGNYTLQVSDALGCILDTTVILSDPPPLMLTLGPDLTLQLGESTTITPLIAGGTGPMASLIWTSGGDLLCSGCPSLVLEPEREMRVRLVITDAQGCTAQDELDIRVTVLRKVFIPNSFSPNFDGINDLFVIYGGSTVERVKRLAVFDRWGNALYLQEDLPADGSAGWDGKYRDGLMDPGVYVWYAEILFVDGTERLYKGEVHLIR